MPPKKKRKLSAASDRPTLNAVQLRKLAEAADGLRGEKLALVIRNESGAVSKPEHFRLVSEKNIKKTDEVLLNVKTKRKRKPLPGVTAEGGDMTHVKVTYGNVVDRDLVPKFDAVFWSEAAVEKFVFEYYLPLKEKEDWDDLYKLYMGNIPGAEPIYGIAHEYPSIDTLLKDDTVHVILEDGTMTVGQYLKSFRKFLPT